MLRPIFKSMPTELKEHDQWVIWREEVQKGRKKASKVPYDASTGKRASVTKRENWTDFETAMSAYKNGDYDGVGFVLTKNDPYIGIDLDCCLINGKLIPEVKEYRLNSYTERSPSGKGLRIFIKGKLPKDRCKKGNFEFYDSGHYLTVTGHHYRIKRRQPKKIQNRQNEFNKSYNKLFADDSKNDVDIKLDYEPVRLKKISVLLKAKAHFGHNRQLLRKFKVLFIKGDWESLGIYPSKSEADLALCNMLTQLFNGDPAYIDGAFRKSKLMRLKWRRRKDYREPTIKKAIARYRKYYPEKLTETPTWEDIQRDKKYNPFESVLTVNEFIEWENSPMQKILDPWLESMVRLNRQRLFLPWFY